MSRYSRIATAAAVLVCTLARPSAAQVATLEAQPSATGTGDGARGATYDELVREALIEVDAEHWLEARELFERAYAIAPNARTLRGLGITAFELRRYSDAVRELSASLDDQRNPLPADLRAEVEDALARAKRFVGSVHLDLEPKTAIVRLDGRTLLDRDVVLDVGEYALLVSADNYRQETVSIRISGGDQSTVTLRLIRLNIVPQSARPGQPMLHFDTDPHTPGSASIFERWWFWTAVGAVAIGTGIGAFLLTRPADVKGETGDFGPAVKALRQAPDRHGDGYELQW